MKEVLSPSLSPVELQLGKREDTPNVTLRPVEQNEKSSRYSDRDKSFEEGLNGTLIAELKENLNKLNTYIPVTSTNLSFEFDDKGDPPFIRVLDKENNEVIREIPSKEFREVAKALDELADKLTRKGVLLDNSA